MAACDILCVFFVDIYPNISSCLCLLMHNSGGLAEAVRSISNIHLSVSR